MNKLQEKQMKMIVENLNKRRGELGVSLAQGVDVAEKEIKTWEREIVRKKKLVRQTKEQIQMVRKLSDLTEETFIDSLELLKKHKKITYAGYKENLSIETAMLYATNKETGEADLSLPIGRFAMRFNVQGNIRDAGFINLDYSYVSGYHYAHPTIENGILCAGDNEGELNFLLRTGNFYTLCDLLISFLSLFPQDGGNPYIKPVVWLKRKVVRDVDNAFICKEPLWEYNGKRKKPTGKKEEPTVDIHVAQPNDGFHFYMAPNLQQQADWQGTMAVTGTTPPPAQVAPQRDDTLTDERFAQAVRTLNMEEGTE